MLCEPPMQSMCSLRHQCHSHGSLPHPVHHCPACAPEARRVVSALAEGIKMPARAPDAPPVRRCSTHAPLPCLCAISAACRECPHRAAQNACSRARCAARAPLLYPRTTALLMRHKRGVSRIPSLSESKCLLARQMQFRAPIPTFICGFAQPFRLRYAGSRSRSPLTHASPLELRSLLQVSPQLQGPIPGFPAAPLPIPGFPAEMAVIGQEYDGKPGIHTGSA